MTDRDQELLIAGTEESDSEYDGATPFASATDSSVGEHEDPTLTPSLFVWLLTFSAGISGLLFGCRIFLFYFLLFCF